MTPHSPHTISLHNITLHRGGYCVLENVNAQFSSGTCTALLGPNGSGKTTLLRAIAGLLPFTSGTLEGADAQMVHFIANESGLKLSFTVAEQIGFWCAVLQGVQHNSASIAQEVGLKSLLNTSISKLSAGQKRRLSLAKLLCAPLPIWCLDEPTNALDSKGLEILRALMQKHIAQNGIIIAATHISPLLEGEHQLNMGNFLPKFSHSAAI